VPPRRIYLDNAATSFPKPPGVLEAMTRYGRDVGASPGRGHYAESREGAAIIRECRRRLNTLIGGEDPSHIVFTLNTSDALNLAIKGVARAHRLKHGPGAPLRLVTTAMDHNSVLRPFAALAQEGAAVTRVDADPTTGIIDLDALAAAVTPGTTLLAVNWVSNVTGTIQPIDRVCALAKSRGVPVLIDAAQGLGHVPFNAKQVGADVVAFPGHKGLLGPQGTGGLYIRPGFLDRIATTREGGTGSISELDDQPETMPERFEAGSHNTIGIAGLSEAAAWHLTRTVEASRRHEIEIIDRVLGSLDALAAAGLRLLGPTDPALRVATFSFVHDDFAPAELATILETNFGILVRAGIHCAPRAHETLGTLGAVGDRGALRASFGPFNTAADADALVNALLQVCARDAVGP